ncbi:MULTISPECIES: ABC transporter permease subunit [Cyanophyceae]|uniref:ABC transporter permease subunit n=1 Tax=Leptolyngbya subtilissima DQ-A4 TaxID=2933933 RepID=A0ABV0K2Z3_9CYAN|nr:ABC transporter permease subunit [Nodosilinea sp. FACHB-141]MBD2113128.1 ABC transporter permease subunit [Nodosilinea sp. FACHB-141]
MVFRLFSSRWLKRCLALVLGLLLGIGAAQLTGLAQDAPTVWEVGTEPAFPPFEMKDDSGNLVGFDIELMTAMGEAAGREVRFITLPFDGLIPALQSRTIDAAISGMTVTAERAQTIDFTRPYFKAGLAIAVRQDNNDITTLEDLEGKRIAVAIGTTGADQAGQVEGATVSTFDNSPLALQELLNGRVDAVVNDLPVTLYAIREANLEGLKIVGELVTEEYYGIAIPKNSEELTAMNDALGTLLQDGTYAEIYQRWFSGEPPELPGVAPSLANAGTASGLAWGRLFQNLIRGAWITILLTASSFFLGLIGGSLVAFAMISPIKPLRWLCRIYVDFFRGTPMLVQLFMIYFGLPALFQSLGFDLSFNRIFAAVLALSLNVAAYLAEILRGGIQSIDRGQWEAGESLAMNPVETMRYVVFPQAFRRILPPLGNEFITLIKDTSLAAVIGFEELFRQGQLTVATTYRAFEVYLAVAIVYLVMTSLASFVFKRLEAYMDPINRPRKAKKDPVPSAIGV